MAVTINNFEIINGGSQLAIDVETNAGANITHITLWTMETFKDPEKGIILDAHILPDTNQQVLIIEAADAGVLKFQDLVFMEVTSNYVTSGCSTCDNPALGITYDLAPYYTCLLHNLLKLQISQCINCDDKSKQMVITINMLIDNVKNCVEVGYYAQAINLINKLKRLCVINQCKTCPPVDCPNCKSFIQF
jgi:hypothetical protein